MKKLLLLCLLLGGYVCGIHAENFTKRIYVVTYINYQQYKTSGVAIHTWYTDGSGDITSWGSEEEHMATYEGFNPADTKCVWFKDITFDETKSVKFKLYDWGNTGWQSSNEIEVQAAQNRYYAWNTSNNDVISDAGIVKYYAYIYDGANWSQEEMTTTDDVTYTVSLDNQTSYNSSMEVLIANSVALDNQEAFGNYIWATMYRPYAEQQEVGYFNHIDYDGGCYGMSNTNSIKLNKPVHYTLTYKPFEWMYSAEPYITKTISAAGYATIASEGMLNLANIEGGLVGQIGTMSGNTVNFTNVNDVPANTGVLLKGAAGEYKIGFVNSSTTNVSNNVLVGVTAETQIGAKTDNKTNFVLMNGNSGVGFYKVSDDGFTVGANTAYLSTAISETAKSFIAVEGGETTGISEVETASDNVVFNLNGMRVNNPSKGLYIMNGKKYIIK